MSVKVMKQSSKFASRNIFHSFQPFHYLAKIIGLGFYNFNVNGSEFVVNIKHKICFWITLTFWAVLTLLVIAGTVVGLKNGELPGFNFEKSKFLSKVNLLILILQLVFSTFLVNFQHNRRRHIFKFLMHLNNFDEAVERFHWRFSSRNSWKFLISVIIFICLVITATLTNDILESSTYFEILIAQLNAFIFAAIVTQFIISVLCIKKRLKVLLKNVK